ncbi:MAG: NADH-quinone oxidoreductase subunit J [Chloroflexi bacterium]|nr:NADH-quinone oxidoreductase subunit J [Chloroflexota bacterium]
MTMDVALFITVGVVAVAAAVMMLLSENAVHSALFLIINFMGVAFLYLMLDAPFLTMIQIAVYAGAIMVLFLFVIMLLGAEKLGEPTRQFRWLAPVSLALALAFLVITSIAIIQGRIDLQGPATQPPALRVVNALTDAGAVDVYLNGERVAPALPFGEATEYTVLPAAAVVAVDGAEADTGREYTLTINAAGTDTALMTSPLVLASRTDRQINAYTVVAHGTSSAPQASLVSDNLETTDNRAGRLTLFNAFERPVDLWNFRSETNPDDDVAVTTDLAPGSGVELAAIPENTDLRAWAFTEAGNKEAVLFRLNNPEVYRIRRDEAQLLVFAGEHIADGTEQGSIRPVALPVASRAAADFGGPHGAGELLFTRYMLPVQLLAVLLLVAMIGAIVLTHKETFQPRRRDVRRRVAQPLTTAISAQVGQDVLQPGEETPRLPPQEDEQPQPVGD